MTGFTEVERDEDGNEIFWANEKEGVALIKLWDNEFELLHNGGTVKQGNFWVCCSYYWSEFALIQMP